MNEAPLPDTPPGGLSAAEALARLERFGPNQLPEHHRSVWILVKHQLDDVLVWLLLVALVLSVVVPFVEQGGTPDAEAFVDAGVIGGILVLNAILGIVQEYRAENAIAALARMSAPAAVVRREGALLEVPAAEVVPGDRLVLEAGDRVAADGSLVDSKGLQADESLLTGESVPVAKARDGDETAQVFAGTLLTAGSGEAVVTATGLYTETGKIAALMRAAEPPKTPLHLQLAALGRTLGLAALAVCLAVVIVGWFRGMPILELLMVGISLAVAAVPEGLPAVVTVCFAAGMQRMVKEHALVRRLDALETLGAVTVIASDKTGTLTANRMTVVDHWVVEPGDEDLLAQIGLSCNHADGGVGDPTEVALVRFGREQGVERLPIDEEFVPFSSELRHMATRHGEQRFWKGAPEALLELHADGVREDRVLEKAAEMAAEGRRVLAAAVGPEDALRLVGLWGMEDPPRDKVPEAIAAAKGAGIRTLMITGDHLVTARAIGERVGLDGEAHEGRALRGLSEEETVELVRRTGVFGRVSPEDKVRICKALQADGHVVAMTGDGVNDAPALRTAHVGVAMGERGTEVAREAAAIVLANDHYATIVTAAREGRRIHDNIQRFVVFLLRANLGELALILLALLVGLPIPYLPVHILWMNLLTDGLPALALSAEPAEPDVMDRPPRPPREHLLHGEAAMMVLAMLLGVGVTFGFYVWARDALDSLEMARTATLTVGVALELLLAYSSRSSGPVWRVPIGGNPWLLAALASVAGLHLVLLYSPMGVLLHLETFPVALWGPVLGLPLGAFAIFEVAKWVRERFGG